MQDEDRERPASVNHEETPRPVAAPPFRRPGERPEPKGVFLDHGPEGILYLTFDQPGRKVNVFTFDLLGQLEQQLDEVARVTDSTAVIARSFKPGCFVAGADLEAIAGAADRAAAMEASRYGQRVFSKVETLRVPVFAAIDGVCLGGGSEFALACHFRLLSDGEATRIGLPEVKLGILPAWGGTQRLPQVVGLRRALDLVLTGRSLDARRARRIGLADACIPQGLFAGEVLEFARRAIAEHRGPRRARPPLDWRARLLEGNPLGRRMIFKRAAERLYDVTHGHYPAPPRALEAMQIGLEHGHRAGYLLESTFVAELVTGRVCKNLVQLFFATEAIKKTAKVVGEVTSPVTSPGPGPGPGGAAGGAAAPRRVGRLGIVGAGVMGGGIAQLAAARDLPVRLKDVDSQALGRALEHAGSLFARQVERRRLDHRRAQQRLALISPTLDHSGFGRADLVIEAVSEQLEVKRPVLRELEAVAQDECVIATNTSSLCLAELCSALRRPERFAGMHFFNPVHRMPLVEVVRGKQSAPQTVATIRELARRLGKTPIIVADGPGFLVNRILTPYLNEACVLLEDGVSIAQIDRAMFNFGMPMGPLRLLDEIGLDVAAHAAAGLAATFGDRLRPSGMLDALLQRERRGRKGGLGFYRYPRGAEPQPDPAIADIAREVAAARSPAGAERDDIITNLQDRLVLVMVNEAARCLEDGVVAQPLDVDLGLVLGSGFPPFRGGLLRHADLLGAGEVLKRLEALAGEGRPAYAPAPLLVDLARRDGTFFPG